MTTTGQDSGLLGPPSSSSGARDGAEDLGENLEAFREYLIRVAREELGSDLVAKVGASDMVQDTFLRAKRGAPTYRGRTRSEWRAWLEKILRNRLSNVRRHYRDADLRDVSRERRLDDRPNGDDGGRGAEPPDTLSSASNRIIRVEREAAVRAALATLPEHYRNVVQWHHEEGMTFEAIGLRLGKSADSVRKMWGRALERLRDALGPGHDPR